jgi:hypothetical protein
MIKHRHSEGCRLDINNENCSVVTLVSVLKGEGSGVSVWMIHIRYVDVDEVDSCG